MRQGSSILGPHVRNHTQNIKQMAQRQKWNQFVQTLVKHSFVYLLLSQWSLPRSTVRDAALSVRRSAFVNPHSCNTAVLILEGMSACHLWLISFSWTEARQNSSYLVSEAEALLTATVALLSPGMSLLSIKGAA